jgi:hypothetical protein
VTGRAWKNLASRFADLHETLFPGGVEPRGASAGQGYEHAGQLLAQALRWHIEGNDPDRPRFIQINDTPEVADNLFAAIRSDGVYRLRGKIGSLFDVNISIHEGWNFRGRPKVWGDLGRQDLNVDADGRFELILGGGERPGDWVALPPDAAFLHVREYYYDLDRHVPGIFEIERLDRPVTPRPRPSVPEASAQFSEALAWVADYVAFHRHVFEHRHKLVANEVKPPSPQPAGNRHIWYGFGKFAFGPDEALLLEFDEPKARMWSVQWLSSPWYESAGPFDRLTGLFGSEAFVGADGRVRIVLAGQDPGVRNWLDTSGFDEGFFLTRWIWCEEGPEPTTRVVALGELDRHLPADEPRLGPAERQAQLRRRQAHFSRRRRERCCNRTPSC